MSSPQRIKCKSLASKRPSYCGRTTLYLGEVVIWYCILKNYDDYLLSVFWTSCDWWERQKDTLLLCECPGNCSFLCLQFFKLDGAPTQWSVDCTVIWRQNLPVLDLYTESDSISANVTRLDRFTFLLEGQSERFCIIYGIISQSHIA